MKIFIVVPTFNRKELLRNCLLSLQRQTNKNFVIIVVNDGSTDGTADMLENEFSGVIQLKGNGSLWWTGATNMGIRKALDLAESDDYAMLLNDDLEVPSDYISNAFEMIKKEPNALIGSVTVDIEDGDTIISGGVIQNWINASFKNLNQGNSIKEFSKDLCLEVSVLTGRGVLIPIRIFGEIGLYDQKHFPQHGDYELPVRAHKKGYKLLVSYSMIVQMHYKATSSINISENFRIQDMKMYFFDVRSTGMLKSRFYYALKTARNPLYFAAFLFFDITRVILHFFRNLKLF